MKKIALVLATVAVAALSSSATFASSEPRCWYATRCIDNGERQSTSATADGSARSVGESDGEYQDRLSRMDRDFGI